MPYPLLAIDLGKTNCRARLLHDGATFEGDGPGAPGLAQADGPSRAEAAILAVALPLLRRAGCTDLAHASVAAAGALAAPDAARALALRLCDRFPARQVTVASDATAAHAGALSGRPGVVLAIGTGAVALAIGADGSLHRADGWGPWLGDAGGGAWLGLQGLRAVFRNHDGGAPPTVLREAAAARFGNLADFATGFAADANPARLAASFAPDIAAAATAGDVVAKALIEQAAALLAATTTAAAARIPGDDPIDLAITGGLVALGPPLMNPLVAALPARLRRRAPDGSPLDGAVLLARNRSTIYEPAVHRAERTEPPQALDRLTTEQVRPGLDDLDLRPPAAIVALVLAAEREAQDALSRATPQLAAVAEAVAARMRAGGRLFYLGAGTPGRLAMLDAAELAPTYAAPPGLVIPLLAGGAEAMRDAVEGAEDDDTAAGLALAQHGLTPDDSVIGIAASGRTPFVVGGLRHARGAGALAVAIVNNQASPAAAAADLAVEILTGPEVVAGSTRMSAGTTQKIALNALSTAVMIALGKTHGARMVDVRATNEKLRRRAVRMVEEITGAPSDAARAALEAAEYRVKPALVALIAGVDADTAERMLLAAGGRVRDAIARKGA